MLRTTPESLDELLPCEDLSGELVITADARLDNRRELLDHLRPAGLNLGRETDSELILAAYRRWGSRCVDKLLGDFAFAIWDRQKNRLFCARDHFGVKPFYYYLAPSGAFIFATEVKALLALPEVPYELNEVRLGDHLAGVIADAGSTFFRAIMRLPAAHTMTVSGGKATQRRYWSFDPARDVRLSSDAEYAEAFRELFTEAVGCRLRSAGPAGSLLSGGLDSSSITCVARNLLAGHSHPLQTFSTIFDVVPECDERRFINPILFENGIDPHFIQGNQHGPFRCLEQLHAYQDQPPFGPNSAMIWSLYEAVGAANVRVLLDGHDGDTTVSHGERYLHEVAQAGRWLKLTAELRGITRQQGGSTWELLRAFGWRYGVNPFINRHRSLRLARRIYRRAANGPMKLAAPLTWSELLNPHFASQINMPERYSAWRQTIAKTAATEREAHYRHLAHPMQAFALELHDSAAGAFAIEKRYPFWDKRLVEFCLALPADQKLSRGWTRVVLRRAMKGILPPEVQWRRDKMDFVPSLAYGLKVFEREQLEEVIIRNPGALEEYVNLCALRRAYQRFLDQESESDSWDLFAIWKTVSLASWLKHARPEARVAS
jgi:asparagine synthase (glutamine-hydrolysing)